jgi:hypothetical protein
MPESNQRFNAMLNSKMLQIGFKAMEFVDKCLYIYETNDGPLIACVHVDDIFLISPTIEMRSWFESELRKTFEITVQHDNLSYLGMNIVYDPECSMIKVNQEGYVKDLLRKHHCDALTKFPKTPTTMDLFDPAPKDSPSVKPKVYLSLLMALMYVARFTRPDILLPISVLATRSADPRAEDMSKVMRVLRYLAADTGKGLVFNGKNNPDLRIYADASHNTYPSGRGQGGILITIGGTPLYFASFKLKSVTRSSSESELVCLEEASTFSVWIRPLLVALDIQHGPIITLQDNMSTIILAQEGGSFKRTKHLIAKKGYVRERIEDGDIVLKHCPTKIMRADFLTKPLTKPKLDDHLSSLNIQ